MTSTQARKNDLIINLVTRKYNIPAYAQRQYLNIAYVNKDERPAVILMDLHHKHETDMRSNVFGLMDELLAGKTVHIQTPETVWGLDKIVTGWVKKVGDDNFEWYSEYTYFPELPPHETKTGVTDTEGAYTILSTASFFLSTMTVKDE